MPGLVKGPGLSLTSGLAYFNSVGFWGGNTGLIDPDATDRAGLYFNTGRYWLNGIEYLSATTIPGWTFTRPGYNLRLQSQFAASWSTANATLTPNSVAAPDGTTTAALITDNTASGAHTVFPTASQLLTANATYTQSVFLKAGTGRYAWVGNVYTANVSYGVTVDLQTGTVTATNSGTGGAPAFTAHSVTVLGDGWVRVAVTTTDVRTTLFSGFAGANSATPSYINDGTPTYLGTSGTWYAWGAQLELGSTVGGYQPTTTTAVTSGTNTTYAETVAGTLTVFGPNTPRITDKGFLVEESRTNLLLRSQEFDNASWSKSATTVTANAAVAPDSTTTADRLFQTTTTAQLQLTQAVGTAAAGQAYTYSMYAKQGTARYIQFTFGSTAFGGTQYANIDLQTGTVGTAGAGASVVVANAGGGWWRIAYTCTATATNNITTILGFVSSNTDARGPSIAGNAANYIDIWGAQFEAASTVSSYIPTTTAAATRAADSATITGLGSILSAPFTLVGWADLPTSDGTNRMLVQASDGTTANFAHVRRSSANAARLSRTASNVNSVLDAAGTLTGPITLRMAGRVRDGQIANATNGVAPVTATPSGAPTGLSLVSLGWDSVSGGSFANGYLTRIEVLRDMSDGQMQVSTVPPISNADFAQYNARLSVPITDPSIVALYTAFFNALRYGAVSGLDIIAATDAMYVLAGPDEQAARQNLVNSAYPLTAVNSPSFTAFSGFLGNGTSSHLTSTLDYSSGVTVGTQNDFQADALFAQGGWTTGVSTVLALGANTSIYISGAATSQGFQAMGGNAGRTTPGSVALWGKLVSSGRVNSSTQQPLFDGAVNGATVGDTSVAPTNAQFRILRSSGSVYSPTRIRFVRTGKYLGASGTLDLRNALNALLTGLGAI